MDYKINLEDKSVIITGAASGIGLECVKGFLQNGSDVYMVDFNGKENEDKAAELRKAFPQNKIFTVTADLTKEEDTEKIISAVKENTGRVDVLINNAGTILGKKQISYETPYVSPELGWAEQDPNMYYNIMCRCARLLKEEMPELFAKVEGVTVSTIRDTSVCVDADGKPLRPAKVVVSKGKGA